MSRVDVDFDSKIEKISERSGLSKVKITRLLAQDLDLDFSLIPQRKKSKSMRFFK